MNNVHDKMKLGAQGCYICEVCGAVFGTPKLVNQHHRRQHTDSMKPLYCEHCTYTTKARACLRCECCSVCVCVCVVTFDHVRDLLSC